MIILGSLDMVSQIGTIFGSFYFLVVPLKKLKRDFFILTAVSSLLTIFLISGKWMESERRIMFLVIYFIIGIIKAASFCPLVILGSHFDSQREAFWMNLWMALSASGDIFSILLYDIIVNNMQKDWSIFLLVSSLILFILVLFYYCFLDELETRPPELINCCETLTNRFERIKEVMFKPRNFFRIMSFSLGTCLYYSILMWYPYYFNLISYGGFSSTITIIYCITFPIGSIVFEQLLKKYQNLKNHITIGSLFILFLLQAAFFLINKLSPAENIDVYLIMSGFSGFVLGGPLSRASSSDLAEEGEGDSTENYEIFAAANFAKYIGLTFCLFFIGFLMEKGKINII